MIFSRFPLFLTLLFIGFVNALPIPLMGSTMSIWLAEAGFNKGLIGSFTLLGIPFSLKILWSPLIDHIALPGAKNCPRKGWLIFALIGMALSLLAISFIQSNEHPIALAMCLFTLSLFSGCLYIVGIAYERESLDEKHYSLGSASVVTGYRLGLLTAGAGALYISSLFNWSIMFEMASGLVLLIAFFILLQPEPANSKSILEEKKNQFKNSSLFQGIWQEVLVSPCKLFFSRKEWLLLLLLILLFKSGDHLATSMEGPFLLSLGFIKTDLAMASKLWGMAATILGAFIAGTFLRGKDPFVSLGWIGLLHATSLGCYYLLSLTGKFFLGLFVTVAIQHLTSGMAMTVFIFFLWRICDRRYAAVQYALLWSVFSLKANLLSFCGGMIAHYTTWQQFFGLTTCLGVLAALVSWRLANTTSQAYAPEKAM